MDALKGCQRLRCRRRGASEGVDVGPNRACLWLHRGCPASKPGQGALSPADCLIQGVFAKSPIDMRPNDNDPVVIDAQRVKDPPALSSIVENLKV